MNIPVFAVEAGQYSQLSTITKVFNESTIEYYLWIHLPPDITRDASLFEVDEILDRGPNVSPYFSFFKREPYRPWIRVESAVLNKEVGKHIYRLQFINKLTNDVFSLYMSYVLQTDDPNKPYIYMKDHCTGCEV